MVQTTRNDGADPAPDRRQGFASQLTGSQAQQPSDAVQVCAAEAKLYREPLLRDPWIGELLQAPLVSFFRGL